MLLVLVTLVWGCTFVLIKDALRDATPLLFNLLRMVLATGCLVLLYRRTLHGLDRATLRWGALAGTFLFLGYAFQTTGLRLTTPSKSAFLTGLSVVLVPVMQWLSGHGAMRRATAAGAVLAVAGLFLLSVPAGRGAWADLASVNAGDMLTVACAVSFAFHIVVTGRATRAADFRRIAVLQTGTAALWMAVATPLLETTFIRWSARLALAIAITGVLATALAFTVQAWAQQFTPASHTALIFSLEPVFAWITSYVVLGERLGVRAAVGAVLILAGVLLSELGGAVSLPAQPDA